MKPVKFPGCNAIIGKDQPEYMQLPALYLEDRGEVIQCWEFNQQEREDFLKYGRIFFSQLTDGHPLQPIKVMTDLSDGLELRIPDTYEPD